MWFCGCLTSNIVLKEGNSSSCTVRNMPNVTIVSVLPRFQLQRLQESALRLHVDLVLIKNPCAGLDYTERARRDSPIRSSCEIRSLSIQQRRLLIATPLCIKDRAPSASGLAILLFVYRHARPSFQATQIVPWYWWLPLRTTPHNRIAYSHFVLPEEVSFNWPTVSCQRGSSSYAPTSSASSLPLD